MQKPLILTMGDPTGVGPEVIVKAWLNGAFEKIERPLLVAGDTAVLQRAARLFHADCLVSEAPAGSMATHTLQSKSRSLPIRALSNLPAEQLAWGRPDTDCGRAMLEYITWACDQCLTGKAAAMVTGPINKQAILAAGCDAPGHTELLARRCGTDKVVMMLGGSRLKVCLVTTHLALKEVPGVLNCDEIVDTIRIVDMSFRRFFGCQRPRLAVLALNPHAGEGGRFGDEEERIIAPAIAAARQLDIDASGPHSADALFHFAARGDYDAVICMYHDQGLIPLKLLHFEDGVNITLGLPIIRTSVDHGTAYDLAGTGQANSSSLVAAMTMATHMAQKAVTGGQSCL